MTDRDAIMEFLQRNRISTTEVADALGKSGVLPDVRPLTSDIYRAGTVRTVFCAHDSNYAVHEQMRAVEKDEVVVVFTHECHERAIFGDLVSKYALLYRGAAALVIDGFVRDGARLRRERYPIWARGLTPLGCFNTPTDPFPPAEETARRLEFDRGVAVCDDGGVVVIPPNRINADMLDRLHQIEDQEDVWYYCLDTLKWDTKKIVCDRAYLSESSALPDALVQKTQGIKVRLDAGGGREPGKIMSGSLSSSTITGGKRTA
jgi:4-hydroxy-4-methyl-2-oxoglutarate aldolase